ncbi:hypothetical protein EDB89DRAFT_202973 [Lactarius sanguifluus]|nr:hypothetical protein EDB89DRAFT_202973 [Lactarius sanguifluus]
MSHSLARNQNQLSEQLQVLELLRKRGGNIPYDQGLGRLAERGSRRGRLAVQDDETLMLQLVALSLVGQTRGDTVAVALDKRDASNFTFVLATNRRHTLVDEDRARQFFQLAASADSERALLLFTLVSSSRKVNRRLVKLKKSIAQCLPAIKRLVHHRYKWPHNDLRKRARELLPVMHVKFGEIPLPKLYVKVLNALARAVAPSISSFDPPSNHDCDRFLDVLNMSTFVLSTRFISWSARRSVYSKHMAILERRLYKVAQYLMGATSLLDMRPTLGDAFPYVWAVVGGEPESVEDIFLLRTPLEVVREIDARWTESTLRAKLTNWRQWLPFSTPRIHAELRLITSCNGAILDPSLDAYDPRKPAAVRIASSHDVCALCALWVAVYNRHFGTRFKVFPAGGSGKIDRNWTFALSPRERPNQDVCELVYDLLDHELDSLQDTPRRPWEVLFRSMRSWACVPKPDESTASRRRSTPSSTHSYARLLCPTVSLPYVQHNDRRILEHSPDFSLPV